MEQNVEITQDQAILIQKRLKLENQLKGGANWFYWIGGLSLLNSLIFIFGGTISFVIGLGITQLVDGIMYGVAEELGSDSRTILQIIGFGINIIIGGVFIAFGYFSRKKIRWVFILGIVLYALDFLFLIWAGDIFGILFHVLAIIGLIKGYRSIKAISELNDNEQMDQNIIRQVASIKPEHDEKSVKRFKTFAIVIALLTVISLLLFLILLFFFM